MPVYTLSLQERVAALEAKDRKHDSLIPRAMRAVSDSVHEHDAETASIGVAYAHIAHELAALRESDERIATEQALQAAYVAEALKAKADATKSRVTVAGIVATCTPIIIEILRFLEAWRVH